MVIWYYLFIFSNKRLIDICSRNFKKANDVRHRGFIWLSGSLVFLNAFFKSHEAGLFGFFRQRVSQNLRFSCGLVFFTIFGSNIGNALEFLTVSNVCLDHKKRVVILTKIWCGPKHKLRNKYTAVSEKKGTFICEIVMERYIYLPNTQK